MEVFFRWIYCLVNRSFSMGISESSAVANAEKELSKVMETYLFYVDKLKNWLIGHGINAGLADLFKILIVFTTRNIIFVVNTK